MNTPPGDSSVDVHSSVVGVGGGVLERTLLADLSELCETTIELIVGEGAGTGVVRQMKLVDDKDDISKQPGVTREAVSLEHACMVIVHNERPVHVGSLRGGGGGGILTVDLCALHFSNSYTISVRVYKS